MTKADLIKAVFERCETHAISAGMVKDVLDTAGAVIAELLAAGKETPLPGLGQLKPVKKEARQGRNPRTGEAIDIPAKVGVKFVPAKALKDSLNEK